jgi:hypothetical protein
VTKSLNLVDDCISRVDRLKGISSMISSTCSSFWKFYSYCSFSTSCSSYKISSLLSGFEWKESYLMVLDHKFSLISPYKRAHFFLEIYISRNVKKIINWIITLVLFFLSGITQENALDSSKIQFVLLVVIVNITRASKDL